MFALIDSGQLRAIRIGSCVRVAESELNRCLDSLAPVVDEARAQTLARSNRDEKPERMCRTYAGRKQFRRAGSVQEGVDIWPGQMRSKLHFSKEFFSAMLLHFAGREIPVGASFHAPAPGSLGEYIQQHLPTKMNPATYVAGLLIEEGYAKRRRKGWLQFF